MSNKMYDAKTDAVEVAEHIELCELKGQALIEWLTACLRCAYSTGRCDVTMEEKEVTKRKKG